MTLDEADYKLSKPRVYIDAYVSHAWPDCAPRSKATALCAFLQGQSLVATVVVMGVMLSLACSPIGFVLADMTKPNAEDKGNGGESSIWSDF